LVMRVGGLPFAALAFAPLAFAALAIGSCGADKLGGISRTGVDAGAGDARPIQLVAVGGPSGSVMAEAFVDEPGVGEQATCAAPMNAGACQLTSCQLGGPVGDPGMGYGNFGPIAATVGTTTVTLMYTGFGYPTVDFPAAVTLGTGGVMKFQGGDGGSVPVFDVSVTIPGLPVLTSPATGGSAAVIDTSRDLTVTWVPISIGQIDFEIYGGVPTGGDTELTILCTFDGASGSGAVPQALLSALKAMSGTISLSGALTSELDATTLVEGLTILTSSHQLSPTTGHAFAVTLQ
jgi:hypothetical protein